MVRESVEAIRIIIWAGRGGKRRDTLCKVAAGLKGNLRKRVNIARVQIKTYTYKLIHEFIP